MNSPFRLLLTRGVIVVSTMVIAACNPGADVDAPRTSAPAKVSPPVTATATASPPPGVIKATPIASGLLVPLALSFAEDGRIFFSDVKQGAIRVIDASGTLVADPVATFPVSTLTEFGLTGLALDPAFATNHRMYAYYSERNQDNTVKRNRLVRLVEAGNKAEVDKVLIDDIPAPKDKHVAGRIAFGPDGMMYVGVGDLQRPQEVSDPKTFSGKILRLTTEGEIPADNPFPGSYTWALGFRNPYGIAFDPVSHKMFVAENGPAEFDEVNVVERSGNYGHPTVFGPSRGRFKDPIWHSGKDSHGMSGITVTRNARIAQLRDRVLFCSNDNVTLHSLPINPDGSTGDDQPLKDVPCSFDVAMSPQGVVYLTNGGTILRIDEV